MADRFRRNKTNTVDNTGFSNTSGVRGARLINKDGTLNLRKTGLPFWEQISLFHTLIRMKSWKFLLSVLLFYAVTNVFFAFLYIIVGVENLQGIVGDNNDLSNGFQQAFFFSSQTLTTVGYGHISPVGLSANIVAAIESFVGILSFAMVTGLLYGRFTLPKAYLKFSENIIVAPHKGYRALMIRLASYKNNHITDVEAKMTVALRVTENGKKVSKFFTPKLEIDRITSLALSWTLVHLINEDSPFYEMGKEELLQSDFEIMYHIRGFDDQFSNNVQQRSSYTEAEMVYGAKFLPAFYSSEDGSTTVLELDKLNLYEPAAVPEPERSYNIP
ncbi:MAG: Inward rectifier potassium channel Irk [Taibaiella sp.]|nr:Inward rectifier potassium channel Irk [Taibaiella sp.]